MRFVGLDATGVGGRDLDSPRNLPVRRESTASHMPAPCRGGRRQGSKLFELHGSGGLQMSRGLHVKRQGKHFPVQPSLRSAMGGQPGAVEGSGQLLASGPVERQCRVLCSVAFASCALDGPVGTAGATGMLWRAARPGSEGSTERRKQRARLHVQAPPWASAEAASLIGAAPASGGGLRGRRTGLASRCLAGPGVTTHNPPSATGCRRMLEPRTCS